MESRLIGINQPQTAFLVSSPCRSHATQMRDIKLQATADYSMPFTFTRLFVRRFAGRSTICQSGKIPGQSDVSTLSQKSQSKAK
jgi:hypothetical protein